MNQDSFRSLLHKSSTGATPRGSFLPPRKPTQADSNSTQKSGRDVAAFQPRKLGKFRDRAAERREGVNDYAEIEGVLEDFEKRNAGADRATVDEQRKYLGGDANHTILVKGLDFALLEQNKARAAAEEDADTEAALEAAFSGDRIPDTQTATSSTSAAKPKRTREERIADLKRRRDEAKNGPSMSSTPSADVEKLERAKQLGKFRPIGAPLPAPTKEDAPEKRKKKKRKLATEIQDSAVPGGHKGALLSTIKPSDPIPGPPPPRAQTPLPPPNPDHVVSPPPVTSPPIPESNPKIPAAADGNDSDEDIFADAGSYKGFASDASSDSDEPSHLGGGRESKKKIDQGRRDSKGDAPQIGRWFGNDKDLASLVAPAVEESKRERGVSENKRQRSGSPSAQVSDILPGRGDEGDEAESTVPTRLQPLSSSLSITELIEIDKQAEAEEKRKARKAKRKAAAGAGTGTGEPVEAAPKKKLDRNQKLQRDYQQYRKHAEKNSQAESSK